MLVRRLVAPDDRVAVEAGDRIVFRTYSSSEVSSTAMNTSAMGEEDVRGVLGA